MLDAQTITNRLKGVWQGSYGSAPCPVCQPEGRRDQNALTIRDGEKGLLLHCKKSGCSFSDIMKALGVGRTYSAQFDPAKTAALAERRRKDEEKNSRIARVIWDEAAPIHGSIAETYLRKRGITCDLPATLRFHPKCWHGPSATTLPAMVAIVEGSSRFAIHRTYLSSDGSWKAAVEPKKMMLGHTTGGAVHLNLDQGPLVVAEGIETALSMSCGVLKRQATVWAALSAAGVRGLLLPSVRGELIIASDGDAVGYAASRTLADRAKECGWQVSLLSAPNGFDWNDMLSRKVP